MCKKSKYLRFIDSLSVNSQRSYSQTLKKFEEYHGTSMEALIDEALSEQSDRVPHHQLKVIDRIEDFQQSLIDENLTYSTIQVHISHIKTIYKRCRIELPYINPVNPKTTKRREYIEYKDVLTKDEIKKCLVHLDPIQKARALCMAQGGLSNEECEHLKLSSFIEELRIYHQKDNILDALDWLSNESHPVIWVTKLIRWKTKKPYYALIGAEAVNQIASAKIWEWDRKEQLSEKLLNCNKSAFSRKCRNVNNKVGLGLVAEESKFRSHNLRRFHATYIQGSALTYEEQSRISNQEIDEMQGRGKTNVQDTYIKTNPLRQKLLYAKVMNNVSLWHKYNYHLTDDDVIICINDPTSENEKLKNEVKSLSRKLEKRRKASEKIQTLKEEMGEEAFNDMIGEILNAS